MKAYVERNYTTKQEAVISQLTSQFQIDTDGIRFFPDKPDEPWLSAEALVSIARQTSGFQSIEESFDQFVQPLNQVIHIAIVVDKDGRIYKRSGAATMGEQLPNGEPIDEHALAGSRALNAVLRASGFHPLRAASVVPAKQPQAHSAADEVASRTNDLKQIHKLAEQKKLIKQGPGEVKNMEEYREWLFEYFGTRTAAHLPMAQRAAVIQALRDIPDEEEPIA